MNTASDHFHSDSENDCFSDEDNDLDSEATSNECKNSNPFTLDKSRSKSKKPVISKMLYTTKDKRNALSSEDAHVEFQKVEPKFEHSDSFETVYIELSIS